MAEQPNSAAASRAFGAMLRDYRERELLSQEQLAERSGLSARTIRYLERGKVRRPRSESIRLLADALCLVGTQRDQFENGAWGRSLTEKPDSRPTVGSVDVRPCQLPPDIADFVGRQELAEQLRTHLVNPRDGMDVAAVPVCAIAGKAGVGKTALAVHSAHQLADDFPDGQLYAGLRGTGAGGVAPLDPLEVLGGFLRALGVDGSVIPPQLEERAALYRSLLARRRMLVVLDDADGENQVRPLLPGSPGSAVLITSRARLAVLEGAQLLQLDVLSPEQAVELLAQITGRERVATQLDAATAIAHACGRLPLAVRIAGARLAAHPHWPLGRMASLLADERGRLDALAFGDLEVRASLSLSYQGLDAMHRRLFRRLALLDAADVPGWVAGALLDRPAIEAETLMEDLVEAQLLDVAAGEGTGGPRYRLHDLLRVFGREQVRQEPDPRRQEAFRRALDGWLALAVEAARRLPAGSMMGDDAPAAGGWQLPRATADELLADPSAWFEAERAAAISVIHQISRSQEAMAAPLVELAWRLTGAFTGFFQLRAGWDEYRAACQAVLGAARRAGDRRGEGWMLTALAECCGDQGRFDEAMDAGRQAESLHQEVGDRRGEAYTAFVVANLHEICEQLDRAVDALQHAWQLYVELDDSQGRAWIMHNLGRISCRQGRFPEAASQLEQALAASRRIQDQRLEALVLKSLGELQCNLGQPGRAITALLKSLELCRLLGDGFGEGFVLLTLAEARLQQGRSTAAITTFKEALQAYRQAGARRGVARALCRLGDLYAAQRQLPQARACLEEALVILRALEWAPMLAKARTALIQVQTAQSDQTAARRTRHKQGSPPGHRVPATAPGRHYPRPSAEPETT
jgi:tetratricopeptide (TPR) repeat protein/transcriptional regulator with XRE-family HTH domain